MYDNFVSHERPEKKNNNKKLVVSKHRKIFLMGEILWKSKTVLWHERNIIGNGSERKQVKQIKKVRLKRNAKERRK